MSVAQASPALLATPLDRRDELSARRDAIRWLRISQRLFVMIEGDGPVGEATFTPRIPGLYTAAYNLHFTIKQRGLDEHVWPLELLMWTPAGPPNFEMPTDAGDWRWRLMIALPDGATQEELAASLAAGRAKLGPQLADSLHVAPFAEGDVAQILHVGPYSAEQPTIERLRAEISAAGFAPRGAHHEIYLGNPQRSAPEKLRTVIRQPVIRKE
jgi:hypothetical protein